MAWKRFGIVLIHKLRILAAIGALLLAGIADSVALSVCAGSADRNKVRKAVIGAVLNQCNPKIHGRPSQPYRGYYATSENERWNGTSDEAETPQ